MNSFQDSVTRKSSQEVLRRNSHVEIQSMEHSVDGEDSGNVGNKSAAVKGGENETS